MATSAASITASSRSCTANRMRARSARTASRCATGCRMPTDIAPPPRAPGLSILHNGAAGTLAHSDDERAAHPDDPSRMLEVAGVTVRFGGLTALDDVSLTVAPGEVVGVIGPNGGGKTTLFNVICGFVRADEGGVRWRGAALDRVHPPDLAGPPRARTLPGVGLFAGLTALENVMAGARPRAGVARALLGLADGDER